MLFKKFVIFSVLGLRTLWVSFGLTILTSHCILGMDPGDAIDDTVLDEMRESRDRRVRMLAEQGRDPYERFGGGSGSFVTAEHGRLVTHYWTVPSQSLYQNESQGLLYAKFGVGLKSAFVLASLGTSTGYLVEIISGREGERTNNVAGLAVGTGVMLLSKIVASCLLWNDSDYVNHEDTWRVYGSLIENVSAIGLSLAVAGIAYHEATACYEYSDHIGPIFGGCWRPGYPDLTLKVVGCLSASLNLSMGIVRYARSLVNCLRKRFTTISNDV